MTNSTFTTATTIAPSAKNTERTAIRFAVDTQSGADMSTTTCISSLRKRRLILGAAIAVVAIGNMAFSSTLPGQAIVENDTASSADGRLNAANRAVVDDAFDRFFANVYPTESLADRPADPDESATIQISPAIDYTLMGDSFRVLNNPFVTGAAVLAATTTAMADGASAWEPNPVVVSNRPRPTVVATSQEIEQPQVAQVNVIDDESVKAPTQLPTVESTAIDVKPTVAPAAPTAVASEPTTDVGGLAEVVNTSTSSTIASATDAGTTVEIVADGQIVDGKIAVVVNDSRIITTNRPFSRVAIARDSLASVQPLSATQLLVTAKTAGTTQLVFWDDEERSQTLLLQSTSDFRQVQTMLDEMLPGEGVVARDLGGRIGLTGTVTDLDTADMAVRIASSFGEAENFLVIAGKQQVSLRIRFAEVSRSAGKEFGVNFGFQDGGGTIIGSNVGQFNPLVFGRDVSGGITGIGALDPTGATQIFGLGSINGDPFAYYINALRESNLLRMLADPELTVISGEQGEFLAGGEIPIPVPQEQGIALEYREYGVRLSYVPVVLGDGRIRLSLATEVSDLDPSTGVSISGTQVPGILKRNTATVVELREGQTLAISGLLESKSRANKSSVPILGDLPVVGALFRSVRYQRQETELIVMITPHLVDALDPDEVPPLPGATWHHPNDIELMIFGQLGGDAGVGKPDDGDRDGSDDNARVPNRGPALESRYAFTPATPVSK